MLSISISQKFCRLVELILLCCMHMVIVLLFPSFCICLYVYVFVSVYCVCIGRCETSSLFGSDFELSGSDFELSGSDTEIDSDVEFACKYM